MYNHKFFSETEYSKVFTGLFLDGLPLVLSLSSFCISQLFLNKNFKSNHGNISDNNKKKNLILSDPSASVCIISCYLINSKLVYFYNEWRRIQEGLALSTRACFSSRANNWTLVWRNPIIIIAFFSVTFAKLDYNALAN